jgi:hypothetical protein
VKAHVWMNGPRRARERLAVAGSPPRRKIVVAWRNYRSVAAGIDV